MQNSRHHHTAHVCDGQDVTSQFTLSLFTLALPSFSYLVQLSNKACVLGVRSKPVFRPNTDSWCLNNSYAKDSWPLTLPRPLE